MEQTVEEAARKYACNIANKSPLGSVHYENFVKMIENAYMQGAEWQAKQSPWISVEERLPEDDNDYIVLLSNGIIGVGIYNNTNNVWIINGVGIVRNVFLYMPIPTFDQILEANKDVLERLKNKES